MHERGKRIGRNEALFREVNERLREVGEGFSLVSEEGEFVCEYGNSTCTAPIRLPLDEYEHVRSDPKWFLIVKDHQNPDFEKVVAERERYLIVEKLPGGPAGIAIRDDPRS